MPEHILVRDWDQEQLRENWGIQGSCEALQGRCFRSSQLSPDCPRRQGHAQFPFLVNRKSRYIGGEEPVLTMIVVRYPERTSPIREETRDQP